MRVNRSQTLSETGAELSCVLLERHFEHVDLLLPRQLALDRLGVLRSTDEDRYRLSPGPRCGAGST